MEENNVPAHRRTNYALNIASGFSLALPPLGGDPEVKFRPGVILQITT
jgi:hypothetical protein